MAEFGFASDGTLKEMVEAQKVTNNILQVMMADTMASVATDLQAIKHIVEQGAAESIFSVGDQIIDDWTDSVTSTTYETPHDVVKFGDVTLQDGETVPGMFLQHHYTALYAMPFDAREAFYYAADGLTEGAYHFTFGVTYGACTKGATYGFELTQDVPAGAQLVFRSSLYSNDPEGTVIDVYESANSTEVYTSAAIASGSSGTDLGTIGNTENGNLNALQRAIFGSNRWSQSAIRQYLNSSAGIGEWWSAQTVWDRAPDEAATYPGFMSGYDSAFLSAIQKVKVTTALNTVSDGGGSEDTYDYFFLPSLEQMYCTPETAGVEGEYFPYWKRACGSDTTIATNVSGAYPARTYAISAKTTVRTVKLRSARLSSAARGWHIGSDGYVFGSSENNSPLYLAPVCVIC